jgi:predicted ATP-grasp superfamily ATP-dependent carboligase
MADRILILGASARAAAASARRAGLEPFAVDLFADRDTRLLCDCLRCPPWEYPEGLFWLARQAPPMPWMYTGGLENYPELVGALAAERELWGNGPEVLAKAREPVGMNHSVHLQQNECPFTMYPGWEPPPDGRVWLRKPVRSAGGAGIRIASPADFAQATGPPDYFLQEFISGLPMSAVLRSEPGGLPALLGMTRQLVGEPWLHAGTFRYSGSVGRADPELAEGVLDVTGQLIHDHGLVGVWGIDFIHRGTPHAWVVELNPRYTASVEVLEYTIGVAALGPKTVGLADSTHPTKTVGKGIYYAPCHLTFPESGPWDESLAHVTDVWRRPDFADVPHPGDVIEPGHPVLTMLTEADTEADCLARLQSRAAELDRLFGVTP